MKSTNSFRELPTESNRIAKELLASDAFKAMFKRTLANAYERSFQTKIDRYP